MAANDGASGVAVMLEIARLLQQADSLKLGVDFICFDAEDWGTPQWDTTTQVQGDPWALGAQYWSQQYAAAVSNSAAGVARYRFGILLDMVGGQGARFYKERFSKQYASQVVEKVWTASTSFLSILNANRVVSVPRGTPSTMTCSTSTLTR